MVDIDGGRLLASLQEPGLSVRRLPSGAGQDAQVLVRMCLAGRIFVPGVGGLGHDVREHTAPDDRVARARVLLRVLLHLAGDAPAAG
jgi:N-carbamoyl-L-amino-acid hydrolase